MALIGAHRSNTFCAVLYIVAWTLADSSVANISSVVSLTVLATSRNLISETIWGMLSMVRGMFGGRAYSYWRKTEVEKMRSATSAPLASYTKPVRGRSTHQLMWCSRPGGTFRKPIQTS
jgi:hypothetical protein